VNIRPLCKLLHRVVDLCLLITLTRTVGISNKNTLSNLSWANKADPQLHSKHLTGSHRSGNHVTLRPKIREARALTPDVKVVTFMAHEDKR